jgi:calcineurin-like phosphoesterase
VRIAAGLRHHEAICDEILAAGADAVTLGNHTWDQRETLVFIERQPRLLRP